PPYRMQVPWSREADVTTLHASTMTPEQHTQIVPWLEAHGITASECYQVTYTADTLTAYRYALDAEGNHIVEGDDLAVAEQVTVPIQTPPPASLATTGR
ncbi:MAG TPA: hypothetical protein VNU01_02175, partial [Egibacteraceae bacterium]|nr:hypothetical protein [Egibacteraceae bacterium]